jgi:anti-anti-sigma regulatory factor
MAVALRAELEPCQIRLVRDFDDGYRRFLRSAILAALDRGHRQVVVDCDEWKRLDLGVLSALIHGAKACAIRGASFELVNLAKELQSDIAALRLTGRLGLYA